MSKETILAEIDDLRKIDQQSQQDIVKKAKVILSQLQSEKTTFPIDAFPGSLANILQTFHDCYKFPLDYYGLGALVVASSLIGNAYAAEYLPKWTASPMIYGIIVGYSGVGKSKALKPILSPIAEIQEEYNEAHTIKMEDHQNKVQQIRDSNLDEDPPREPVRKRIILNKATMEAVQKILSKNPNGCLLIRQELSGWIKSMNQYRSGDDNETWLEIWDNEDIIVDRVGKDLFIKRANVNILGGIQPAIIQSLAADSRAENGFLARLLFAYPDDLQKPYPNKELPHHSVYEKYKKIMKYLHYLPNLFTEPVNEFDHWKIESIHLKLSYDARELYYQFLIDSTDEQNRSDFNLTKAILAKLDTYCLRFCCILELLKFACELAEHEGTRIIALEDIQKREISLDTVKDAIKLVEYFKTTAMKVTQRLDSPVNELNEKQKAWYQSLEVDKEYQTKELIEIGKQLGLSQRTVERIYLDKKFFKKLGRGRYEKIFH